MVTSTKLKKNTGQGAEQILSSCSGRYQPVSSLSSVMASLLWTSVFPEHLPRSRHWGLLFLKINVSSLRFCGPLAQEPQRRLTCYLALTFALVDGFLIGNRVLMRPQLSLFGCSPLQQTQPAELNLPGAFQALLD